MYVHQEFCKTQLIQFEGHIMSLSIFKDSGSVVNEVGNHNAMGVIIQRLGGNWRKPCRRRRLRQRILGNIPVHVDE